MGIYNEILSARFARALQKLFSMKGSPPVRALGGELIASVAMFYGAECRYLEGWERFAALATVAASVGNTSGARFRNPAGTNVVIVIEKLVVSVSANAAVLAQWGQSSVDLATVQAINGNRFDSRGRPNPLAVWSNQNTAAAIPALTNQFSFDGQLQLANTPYPIIQTDIQELQMLPGDAAQLSVNAVNIGLQVAIAWRERPLEESERT